MSAEQKARDWPDDQRYMNVCRSCGERFNGPKRALRCWVCRTEALTANSPPARGTGEQKAVAWWLWRFRTEASGPWSDWRATDDEKAYLHHWGVVDHEIEPLYPASALAAEYERGARDMRERALAAAETAKLGDDGWFGLKNGTWAVHDGACNDCLDAIRALPLTPEHAAVEKEEG